MAMHPFSHTNLQVWQAKLKVYECLYVSKMVELGPLLIWTNFQVQNNFTTNIIFQVSQLISYTYPIY